MNEPFGFPKPDHADDPQTARPEWARPSFASQSEPTMPLSRPALEALDPPASSSSPRRAGLRVIAAIAALAVAVGAGFVGGRLADDPAPAAAPAPASSPGSLAAPPAGSAPASSGDLSALYQALAPSVVQIVSSGAGAEGAGSGVILDANGIVLTNNHVVGGDSARVVLSDGRTFDGTVAGRDTRWDLAVIRLDNPPADLTPARLGDSSKVVPGETVVAIGAPFGLRGTLTSGIVSAINRTFSGGREAPPMRGLIQTDAAINPGNSGGPLFNLAGEVIGITTAIESPIRGSVGVGFAVPINQAQAALPALVRGETRQHPFLGITGDAVSGDGGVTVEEITPGTSADGRLRVGDVITAFDGEAVSSVDELARALDQRKVGETVTLTVRRDGKTISVPVTLRPFAGG